MVKALNRLFFLLLLFLSYSVGMDGINEEFIETSYIKLKKTYIEPYAHILGADSVLEKYFSFVHTQVESLENLLKTLPEKIKDKEKLKNCICDIHSGVYKVIKKHFEEDEWMQRMYLIELVENSKNSSYASLFTNIEQENLDNLLKEEKEKVVKDYFILSLTELFKQPIKDLFNEK